MASILESKGASLVRRVKMGRRLKVPAAQKVDLYIAAVNYSAEPQRSRALYYGVVRNLGLPGGATIKLDMSHIDWTKASWHVAGEDEHIWYTDREYEADASRDYLDRPTIYVRDPFQVGEYPRNYHDLLIGITGHSSWRGNSDGWRLFVLRATNEGEGKSYAARYEFCPYLKGNTFDLQFDLPQVYYLIEPTDNAYWVHWKL